MTQLTTFVPSYACNNTNSGRNMFVRRLWLKYITNIEEHFVCYLYIKELCIIICLTFNGDKNDIAWNEPGTGD